MIRISNSTVFSWILGLVALDTIVLIAWNANDPIGFRRKIISTDSLDFVTETAGQCSSEGGTSTTYFGIICGIHAALLLYGNYLCYQCRNLNGKFSETKYIAIAMVSNIQVLALGIPVVLIVANDAIPNYFVRVGVLFLNDFTVLMLIFAPKIAHVSFRLSIFPEDNSLSTSKSKKTAVYTAPESATSDV